MNTEHRTLNLLRKEHWITWVGFEEFVVDGADEAVFNGNGWDKACF